LPRCPLDAYTKWTKAVLAKTFTSLEVNGLVSVIVSSGLQDAGKMGKR
jgi:hypothetical protein